MYLYFSRLFIHEVKKFPQIFPIPSAENVVICFTLPGSGRGFSALIADKIVDYHIFASVNVVPLYLYQPLEETKKKKQLFEEKENSSQIVGLNGKKYLKKVNIKRDFLRKLEGKYGTKIEPAELFYYVFAVLSNPEYGEKYANDLKRESPRIPFLEDYETFKTLSELERRLAELQLNYQNLEEYPLKVEINPEFDKNKPTELRYNDCITIKGIPEEVHNWKIAGRSPIE